MSKRITYQGRTYRQVKGRCGDCALCDGGIRCLALPRPRLPTDSYRDFCGPGGHILRETFASRFRHFFAEECAKADAMEGKPEIVDMPGEAPPVVVFSPEACPECGSPYPAPHKPECPIGEAYR
jgi:hypothetical protein